MSAPSAQLSARRISGLRANALAGLVMLLIEYGLGMSASLYSALPAGDVGKSLPTGFTAAVRDGPLLVSIHALLGTLLLITAVAAVIRSARLAAPPLIALSSGALLATLLAWLAGSQFVGHMKSSASLTMALAAAVAILCYALVIFVLSLPTRPQATVSPQDS